TYPLPRLPRVLDLPSQAGDANLQTHAGRLPASRLDDLLAGVAAGGTVRVGLEEGLTIALHPSPPVSPHDIPRELVSTAGRRTSGTATRASVAVRRAASGSAHASNQPSTASCAVVCIASATALANTDS